eukprot:1804029-Rhodomonas_salina.2
MSSALCACHKAALHPFSRGREEGRGSLPSDPIDVVQVSVLCFCDSAEVPNAQPLHRNAHHSALKGSNRLLLSADPGPVGEQSRSLSLLSLRSRLRGGGLWHAASGILGVGKETEQGLSGGEERRGQAKRWLVAKERAAGQDEETEKEEERGERRVASGLSLIHI